MTKLLVLILLALLLGLVLERLLRRLMVGLGLEGGGDRRRSGSGRSRGGASDPPASSASSDVTLAPCDSCGVHVPRSRLERHGGRSLCSRCRAEG